MARFREILASIFIRFPYFNGISLLMLLAERATREEYPFINPYIIYLNVGLFSVIGLCLSGKLPKKEVIGLYCVQLLYLSYIFYSNPNSKYQEWQKLRLSVRPLGLIGVFCIYADSMDKRPMSFPFKRAGENMLGIYHIAVAYMLVNFKLDQRAFYSHFIHSETLLYLYAGLLVCCAICFLSGMYIQDGAYVSAVLLLFLFMITETDMSFWQRQGMELWNQIRILGDSICVVVGLLIIATAERGGKTTSDPTSRSASERLRSERTGPSRPRTDRNK